MKKILGISCFYHDSAVAAVEGGDIKFAVQEERLSRRKHDSRFPVLGLTKALETCKWRSEEVDEIVYYEQPALKLARLRDQIVRDWPRSWNYFSEHLPSFYQDKFPVENIIRDALQYTGKVSFREHHYSHAASTFFTSAFNKALIVTMDGVGEQETVSVYQGDGNQLTKLAAIHFPDSLGLYYSVFTEYLGFRVNSGEYKVMGLACYGQPRFLDKILGEVIVPHGDGSFHLNSKYFDFTSTARHGASRLIKHLGVPRREPEGPMDQVHMDLAASVQRALEIVEMDMLRALLAQWPNRNLCLAGGVALNCTANSVIRRELDIDGLHIHPAAGDAGGALGAALGVAAQYYDGVLRCHTPPYLGTSYPDQTVEAILKINNANYVRVDDAQAEAAKKIAEGRVIAVLQGRDEWGPRALGNRSIFCDPRKAEMKDVLNSRIKFRESFRPFAPLIMHEHFEEYFDPMGLDESPYMLYTHPVRKPEAIPAVTHIDNTGRVQTMKREQNPWTYGLLERFKELTGVPVIVNTSFNLRGEPIVCNPADALKTFGNSGIEHLFINDFMISKN